MKFPACKHRCRKDSRTSGLRWLAAEPYRIFFVLGTVWSLIGVALWPLYYQNKLPFYPLLSHARLMIEGFGGAFVAGFLGTAGPRMASAPKLTPLELLWLSGLHTGAAALHLCGKHQAGDAVFAALLISMLGSLLVRVLRFRQESPPPQMLLAVTGLASGTAGALMYALAPGMADLRVHRLAALLLYQGLLLPPVLGIGSFVFPRILGGSFGEPATRREARRKRAKTLMAALLLTGSFVVEAYGFPLTGNLLRVAVCLGYLGTEIPWRKQPGQGTMAAGLKIACILGLAGLALAAFASPWQRISVEHLLYVGGFGLLMLVVGSRVLFGHSGQLVAFAKRSWPARLIIGLAVLAAITRAVPALAPGVTISHHQYAAFIWAALGVLWLVWHRRRFVQRDEEEAETEPASDTAKPH